MSLTDKQEIFCLEYMKDLNATQAAIRAGYSEDTARQIGSDNLSKVDIQERIQALMAERAERVKIDADYVLKRHHEIDEMDVLDILTDEGNIRPLAEWPKVWRTYISGVDISTMLSGDIETITKKIKWPDKLKNLELLGKHVKVQAYKENMQHKFSAADEVADLMAEIESDVTGRTETEA